MLKKYEEIIKYLICGLLTTLVSFITYFMFTRIFHINYLISNILSWIVSVAFAFFTNKKYVFKSEHKMFKELIQFYFFRLVSLLIEMIILYLLVDVLLINDMITKIIAQIIVIISNYLFSKIIFKKEDIC